MPALGARPDTSSLPGGPQIQHKEPGDTKTDFPNRVKDNGHARSQPPSKSSAEPNFDLPVGVPVNPSQGQFVSPATEGEPKRWSPAENTNGNPALTDSLRDINGQIVPQSIPLSSISSTNLDHYKNIISSIYDSYGTAFAVQQMQQALTGNRDYGDSGVRIGDALFTIFAQNKRNPSPDEIDQAVRGVLGNRKPVADSRMMAVFVPADMDDRQVLRGFFQLRKELFSSWVIKNVPGQSTGSIEKLEGDYPLQEVRWVNIDPDHYAMVVPGKGFVVNQGGNVLVVSIKDVTAAAARISFEDKEFSFTTTPQDLGDVGLRHFKWTGRDIFMDGVKKRQGLIDIK